MILLLIIFLLMFVSHSIFLIIVVNNMINAPRLTNNNVEILSSSFVSILIPARNEENNIGDIIKSLTGQSFKHYEILILDDNSTDGTAAIVNEYSSKNENVKLINGKPLPEGWLGKNWACRQLANEARFDLLLFIDADVRLDNNALSNSIDIFNKNRLSMLSTFPTQKINSFGEWLVVPLMNWLLLTFLPLRKVFTSGRPAFTAANGQFILISKNDYFEVGTHEAIRDKVVEDMELAKALKRKKKKVMTALGDEVVFCSMYSSFGSAFDGFGKNFYAGFGIGKLSFIILITIFLVLFFIPFVLVFVNSVFILIVFMILLQRIFISIASRQSWPLNLILHPVQMIVMYFIGMYSALSKKKLWKERKI